MFEVLSPELQTVVFKTQFRGDSNREQKRGCTLDELPAVLSKTVRKIPADLAKALGEPMSSSEVLDSERYLHRDAAELQHVQSYDPNLIYLEKLHPNAVCSRHQVKTQISFRDILLQATGFPKTP